MYKRANLMMAEALKKEILAFVDGKCAENNDGFQTEFTPRCFAAPLTYTKKETPQKTSWNLHPSPAPDGAVEALQTAVNHLPHGIRAKVSTKRTVRSTRDGGEAYEIHYYLDITVSPQYSASVVCKEGELL